MMMETLLWSHEKDDNQWETKRIGTDTKTDTNSKSFSKKKKKRQTQEKRKCK